MIDYNFDNNGVKFTNNGVETVKLSICGIFTGTNIRDGNRIVFLLKKGETKKPEFNYVGYSSIDVYKNDDYLFTLSLHEHLTKGDIHKPNLVCIGLNKTGTTSLRDSLTKQGFSLCDENYGHQFMIQDFHNGNIYTSLSFLESPKFNLYEDLPFSLTKFYQKIYDYRPQDYYILTLRDNVDQWVDSVIRYYYKDLGFIDNKKDNKLYIIQYPSIRRKIITKNYLTLQMYDWGITSTVDLENKLRDVYNRHTNNVFNFFDSKINSKFISIHVSKKDELLRLSKYVDFNTTENDFLWVNKKTTGGIIKN